jgi:hypothetical protein
METGEHSLPLVWMVGTAEMMDAYGVADVLAEASVQR